MKKLGLFVITLTLGIPALAQADYGMGGCGLGSLWFKKNTKTHQVLAATTNGSMGNNTFGITTGTSNCTADGAVSKSKEKQVFVAMNFETLNKEMAQGSGETLYAFADLLGCSDVQTFGKYTQANYESSFGKASTPEELLQLVDTGSACKKS